MIASQLQGYDQMILHSAAGNSPQVKRSPFWSGVIMRQKSIVILSRETQATLTFKVENGCRWCFWASCKRSLGYQIHFESFSNTLQMLVDNVFAPKRVHGRGSSSKTF